MFCLQIGAHGPLQSKESKTKSKVFEKNVLQIVSPSQSIKIIILFVCFLAQFINICSSPIHQTVVDFGFGVRFFFKFQNKIKSCIRYNFRYIISPKSERNDPMFH